jgi:hypothetical protein
VPFVFLYLIADNKSVLLLYACAHKKIIEISLSRKNYRRDIWYKGHSYRKVKGKGVIFLNCPYPM